MQQSQRGDRQFEPHHLHHICYPSPIPHLDLACREFKFLYPNEKKKQHSQLILHGTGLGFFFPVSYLRCWPQMSPAMQHGTNIREADGTPGAAASITYEWIRG